MIIARRRVHSTKYNVPLVGLINGTNQTYTTPDLFNATTIAVYYNGQRLQPTDDFTLGESGGPGTGYDTVSLVVTPQVGDHLLSDYILAT